ncbi:MAG: PEP-CTERM sorting domain-containing protein [Verrucomicrobiota bacterium JB025]|nr:PEP-CTERM sorting domain-containing protein [Verrucomicrobiota bacterium JB025]
MRLPNIVKHLSALGLTAGLTTISASAALVVYEGFDYAEGSTLAGGAGGTGFDSAWTTNNGSGPALTVGADSIAFPGLLTTGGSILRAEKTNITTSARVLDSTSVAALTGDGTTLWGSFLYLDGNGDGFNADSSLSLASTTAAVANNHVLSAAGYGVGLAIGENTVYTEAIVYEGATAASFATSTLTDATVLDATSLFVFSIEWGATEDVLSFYRITDLSDPLPTAFSTTTFNFSSTEQASLNTLNIVESQTGEFDEIRLGTSLESVLPVPEPGSLVLLSLGSLAFFRRKRG